MKLVDASSGRPIRGVEDLAVDRVRGRLVLAALDRWALEDAIDADAARLPEGAIYVVDPAWLGAAPAALALAPLRPANGVRAFHPHGIDVHDQRLAVVNRAYERSRGGWVRRPLIEVFELREAELRTVAEVAAPPLCRPNDVAWLGPSRLAVSNVGACRPGGSLLGPSGTLWALDQVETDQHVARLVDGIAFANGVARLPDGSLAVAATRAARIVVSGEDGVSSLTVPGGPDNLTTMADGTLVAALHPSLLRLAAYRHRWFAMERARSRVVAVRPSGKVVNVLDDDGSLFSAATVAVLVDDLLVVGSVVDDGLLVCRVTDRLATEAEASS